VEDMAGANRPEENPVFTHRLAALRLPPGAPSD